MILNIQVEIVKYLKSALAAFLVIQGSINLFSQSADTIKSKIVLDEVVVSVNKTNETKRHVAQQVLLMKQLDYSGLQSQTTADLISSSGLVYVQKSQLGGGSLTIRGFEANRNLILIDGVRMNNIIYRSGHLQNIVTTDNNILEKIEILLGPASTIHGSDALGGVVQLFTKDPKLRSETGKLIDLKAFIRYSSSSNENTGHLDFNLSGRRLASLTSLTYSIIGDLKSGEQLNPFYKTSYGERNFYVKRINNIDSVIRNKDPFIQVQSGYEQYDFLQKFVFRQNSHLEHKLNFQFSNSGDVNRYDRLTESDNNVPGFAQWYYGPQKRLMAAYDLNYKNTGGLFHTIDLGINYQDIEESRHSRRFNSNNLAHRRENVSVYGMKFNILRTIDHHQIRFGLDGQYNDLVSTAWNENITDGGTNPLDTRYPGGDNTMFQSGIYISHTWNINDKFILVDGIRVGTSRLSSEFTDTTFFKFPFTSVVQKNKILSGNIGLIYNPNDEWKLSLLFSSGYRVPNVDDLAKVFESSPGNVIVPNKDLKPERTFNYEAGITKVFNEIVNLENSLYYTRFLDAIVTDQFQFNGFDSIVYDGVKSRVLANQNKRTAYVLGASSTLTAQLNENIELAASINYTYGRIKYPEGTTSPLDHIPPLMSRISVKYKIEKLSFHLFLNYNGWKKIKDYYLNGEDNEQYATPEGMPAWMTANFHLEYRILKMLTVQSGIDNIFDTQYRTFASGINGSGRNFFLTIRFRN